MFNEQGEPRMSFDIGSNQLVEYWLDAVQRTVLFLDVLRQRGNIYLDHNALAVPHVLDFKAELIMDGRKLERPVNYALVRIARPDGRESDPAKRPFIVVDPRAGHGPGIGGMKQDSEIGIALAAGHPCYFIGFLPQPVPGQTVEDVCRAEAKFVAEVAARHPQAEGKPVIIANCQAGWQIMMMAAIEPELAGPIMLAGAPLSYWAGVRGKNPMRYAGGLLGGTWLATLAGDLGNGIFDGAHLVANFEALNPANTYWRKPYNVYSKVDTEAPRFLEFETWWGSPVLLNAGEMQSIADNLFVGNKLATGGLRTAKGLRVDLRNVRSPIIVFCSWGDNITPPQQALGWITDLYDEDRQITANGQTIVYTLHQAIGHLGIFVSGKVAGKEHGKFTACMDMIDLLPPGLYEAVITEVTEDTANPDLIQGRYLFRLEPRALQDIRALGANSPEDDLRFATVARVSEVNQGLYRTLVAPVLRPLVTEAGAEALRNLHPNRVQFAMFSDRNPLMQPLAAMAEMVREERRPVGADNQFLAFEKTMSSWIETCLDVYGKTRDMFAETIFLSTYGSPLLQAMIGLGPQVAPAHQHIERDLTRELAAARSQSELEQRFEAGGLLEATFRALIYVRLPEGQIDERGFAALKAIRAVRSETERFSMAELKKAFRDQYLLVRSDEKRALRTLPALLPASREERRGAMDILHRVIAARGVQSAEGRRRLREIEVLFGFEPGKAVKAEAVNA